MRKLNLFYLAAPKYGGWVSYTAHLSLALRSIGWDVRLFKVSNKSESKLREFVLPVGYQNVSINDALSFAYESPSIICALDKNFIAEGKMLLSQGAGIVIHDTTEMRDEILGPVKQNKSKVIVIRRCNVENLAERGVKSVYIPHPYFSFPVNKLERNGAITLSRIDWDKLTHVIVEANLSLDEKNKIKINGAANRLYCHHKLVSVDPHWERNYGGEFPRRLSAGIELANAANYVVDLSKIVGDGGGTQYTFLEAIDAGAVLVLNKDWIKDGDVFEPNVNCLTVSDARELVNAVSSNPKPAIAKAAKKILNSHAPDVVAPEYDKFLYGK